MATVAEEIARKRAAAALNEQADSPDPDPDTSASSDDADTAAPADEEAIDQGATEEPSTAVTESRAPSLGYKFVPLKTPVSTGKASDFLGEQGMDIPAEPAALIPRGTFYGSEEGMDVTQRGPKSTVYEGPPEEGGQRYVIDKATGAKIPYAELASEQDKLEQPPGGIQLRPVTVTGEPEVRRAELVDPDPDRQYLAAVAPRAEGVPAPDTLSQVERGELVKLPAEAPAQLSQVERGELVKVPPGTAPRAVGIPSPPKVLPAQPALGYKFVPVAPAVQAAQPGTQPASAQAPQVAGIAPLTAQQAQEPGIDIQSNGYSSGRGDQSVKNVILHSTDGTEKGDINTLTQSGQVGVHYYVTKDGRVMHFVSDADSAWQAGKDKYGGNANPYTIGIEQEHIDGKEGWPDAQVRGTASTVAAILMRNPSLTISDVMGHSDIAGERKQDPVNYPWDKFRGYVAAYMGQGPAAVQAPGAAPQAQPVTKQANGLYQNEKPQDFLTGKATTFATPEDLASGQDNGVGASRLGKLDTTQVAGVAIPEEALRAKYGNNYAAWRTARVDVVDPQTGNRLRVPIVDLGPRGDLSAVTDMTPTLSNYFGGDKNLMVRLVDKAGPDVTKNPQLFADEQAAIKQGIDSSTLSPAVQTIAPKLGYTFKPQSPEGAAQAQKDLQTAVQQQQDTISKLPEAGSGNVIGLYKRLDSPVEGVSSQSAQAIQANLKPQIIALMRQKFPELINDDQAWTKAQSDVNALDVGREWATKVLGYAQQFTNVVQKGTAGTDQFAVDRFLAAALPNASDAEKHDYLTKLYSMPIDQRSAEIEARLGPGLVEPGNPNKDPQFLARALDRVADPNLQKRKADDLAKAKAEMQRNVSDDPRLAGTGMEKIVDATAQMPAYIAAFSNPVLMPIALAQVADQVRESFRAEHPEWDQKTLEQNTTRATLVQFYGQEAANLIIVRGAGALTSGIESPAKRAIATAILGIGSQPAVTAGTQAAANIATGEPIGKGVGEAAITGLIQGVVPGVVHGARELMRPGGEPVRPVTERPPVTEQPPPVRGEEPPVRPAGEPMRPVEPVSRGEEGIVPPPAVPVTQEDVARRAYELYDERTKNGQLGTAYDDYTQAQKELSNGDKPTPVTQGESEPWVSAIANRFSAERMASGELGDVIPGEGYSKEELLARGLQMGPEQINQHVSDLMNNVGGDPKLQAAAVRAEEARLSQRSNAASRALEANPADKKLRIAANEALDDLTDFHNGPVAKLKNNWHAQGITLQGEVPIDLSTFNGLREAFFRRNGKLPSTEMEPVFEKAAKSVVDAATADKAAMNKLGQEIERQSARRRLPSEEQVINNIMERMRVDPCRT